MSLGIKHKHRAPHISLWAQRLQPAKWRDVPFVVTSSEVIRGRRTALHEYPGRDSVWVEDLGRGTRRYGFKGFLVGDDVYDQRDRFLAAVEQPGPAVLVHPSLGRISVSLVEPFSASETMERGRVVELQLTFIENGAAQFPDAADDTQTATNDAADDAAIAASDNFDEAAGPGLALGAPVVNAAALTAAQWAALAQSLGGDAARALGAVRGIAGLVAPGAYFGRYANGGLALPPALAAVNQALPLAAQTKAATSALIGASDSAAAGIGTAANAFTAAAVQI